MFTEAVAPDGTPVAPYVLLPADDEAELIHRALSPAASVLELGCGTGRVSRRLAALGHRVQAVDQSPEMLRHAASHAHVETLCSDIEALQLNRVFDGVVLASYLVNVVDGVKRMWFLSTCHRHVADDGVVIIQRLDPETHWASGAESVFGPVRVRLAAAHVRDQTLDARIEYRIDDQMFPQAVVAKILDDRSLIDALGCAGLRLDRFIDPQRTWVVARPMTPSY